MSSATFELVNKFNLAIILAVPPEMNEDLCKDLGKWLSVPGVRTSPPSFSGSVKDLEEIHVEIHTRLLMTTSPVFKTKYRNRWRRHLEEHGVAVQQLTEDDPIAMLTLLHIVSHRRRDIPDLSFQTAVNLFVLIDKYHMHDAAFDFAQTLYDRIVGATPQTRREYRRKHPAECLMMDQMVIDHGKLSDDAARRRRVNAAARLIVEAGTLHEAYALPIPEWITDKIANAGAVYADLRALIHQRLQELQSKLIRADRTETGLCTRTSAIGTLASFLGISRWHPSACCDKQSLQALFDFAKQSLCFSETLEINYDAMNVSALEELRKADFPCTCGDDAHLYHPNGDLNAWVKQHIIHPCLKMVTQCNVYPRNC